MSLLAGTRLGPYEIGALLGVGGMGEVHRATDTTLKRQVAIKVLPESVSSDGDRLARLQREAEALATLNHPNIAQIFGLERSGGTIALVMELVEGPTLAERIATGAVPLDEALPIATQIAAALAAAHAQGIIHRDLKPANIKVREDGTVKVLDFGLAKAMPAVRASTASASLSPTITTPAITQAGMLLGTAAYMSPEQAKGRAVDKRADLWAFGAVLYEILTAQRAFGGEDVADTLAHVLTKDPDWTALPAHTPAPIRKVLRRCLEKDRTRRFESAADAGLEIADALTVADDPGSPGPVLLPQRSRWRRSVPMVVATLGAAIIASGATWLLKPSVRAPATVSRFAVLLPESQTFTNAGRQLLTISPDGAQMVYVANRRLYLRTLSDVEARPIAGIDGSYPVLNPVFSPDGQFIAFYSGEELLLKRISVRGGEPVTLAQVDAPFGMSWGVDGILIGQGAKGIVRVPLNGGAPEPIIATRDDEVAHGPQMLPDGRTVLFTLTKTAAPNRWDRAQIVVQSLTSGERTVLIDRGTDARYLPTGHLLYAVGGVVYAVPLDLRRLVVSGAPVSILEGVRRVSLPTGTAQFSVAANGTLIYIPGPLNSASALELGLIDRQGAIQPLKLPPGPYDHPRVSPDGKRIAFGTDDGKDAALWIYDLSGTTAMRRLTFEGRNRFPLWSSDGQQVAFQSDRGGDLAIFSQRADGTGTAARLTRADPGTAHIPESWSPRGDGFLYRMTKGSNSGLWFFSLGNGKAEALGSLQSFTPTNAVFSRDGRWIAYETSTDLGKARVVYVRPFPATDAMYQLPLATQSGNRHPLWSPDGSELFFVTSSENGSNTRLMVAGVTTRPDFVISNPVAVPRPAAWLDSFADIAREYDITLDGRQFLGRIAPDRPGAEGQIAQIQVVLNWTEELEQRVPIR